MSSGDPSTQLIPHDPNEESTLAFLLALANRLRRHWWLAVLVLVVAVGASAYHTLQQPIFYTSTVTLMLQNRPPRVVDKVTEVYAEEVMADAERFVNGQIRLMQSDVVAAEVEARLKLPKGSLTGRLNVILDRNSHVATLSIDDLDPERARTLVDTFAEVYIAGTVEDRSGVAADAAHFLEDEAKSQRAVLESDEKALYDFDKKNELPASTFEDSHKIASSTLEALYAHEAQARSQLIKLNAEMAEIQRAGSDESLKRQLALPSSGQEWGQLQTRRAQLLEQVNELSTRYGPQHPKVVEAREALNTIDQVVDGEVDTAIAAVAARQRATENELKQVRAAIGEETHKAVALRQKELEYNRLKRQLDEDRDAYSLVAKRQRETELQALLKQTYVKRLDGPSVAAPISRNLGRNLAMAIILGLALGIGLALLLDLLDDSLKSPHEAERELKQPLLGIMMSIPAQSPGGVDVEVERAEHLIKHPRSPIAEQCQSMATQVFSQFLERPPRALMVVSASVEDGKTLTAVNLAATAAARGKRVLLVDADLRRGRLHKVFQLSRSGGLYELVSQKISLDEATRRTWIPHVDIITTGDVPEKLSPLRILEHRDLPAIIDALKERYDLIVFDTAPLPLVSDAVLLGPYVEGAIGVARARKTSRALTKKLAEHLIAARVSFLGWVLNDVPEAELKSKYYYRYGYGRGYGYADRENETA